MTEIKIMHYFKFGNYIVSFFFLIKIYIYRVHTNKNKGKTTLLLLPLNIFSPQVAPLLPNNGCLR